MGRSRDLDLCVRSRPSRINGGGDKLTCSFDARPTGCAQRYNCNESDCEVLLVLEIQIGRDQYLEALRFSCSEQLAILERGPTVFVGRNHLVVQQKVAQWRRRALVEKDSHLHRGQRTSSGVLQHRTCLIERDAGEQLDELTDRHPVFEVLKQGRERHARAAEDPGPADALGVAFYRRAT